MNRQEMYQEVMNLHEQGVGCRRIHKILPCVPLGTINGWLYQGQKPWPEPDLNPSPALSYVLGVLYGDGYTYIHRNSHVIGLKAKDREFVVAFCEAMNKINLHPYIDLQQRKYYRATISSKRFFEWFRKVELGKIESLVSGHEVDFIRGVFDSEGTLGRRKDKNWLSLSINDTNFKLLQLIRKLLFKLGFRTNIYKINMLNMPKSRKQYYHLRLLGGTPEATRFLKLIQPSIPRKNVGGLIA